MEATDAPSLEELPQDECLRLLASQSVGRLAMTTADDEAPLVVPVNYAMDGDVVVFRSGAGTKIDQVRQRRVSFQVDYIDLVHHAGWSVLLRGHAHEATAWEIAHMDVEPWVPGPRNRWVRIKPTSITGRIIHLPGYAPDRRGYA